MLRPPNSDGIDVMTGDGTTLKILDRCELEFPFAADSARVDAVLQSSGPNNEEERSAGPGPWNTVRPSKVKRARALLKDPDYPSKSTIDAMAGVLARHFGPRVRPGKKAKKEGE